MGKPKGMVVKSKSSNSAITTKSDNKYNKKSKSNAEFQPHVLKKRGVYVAKKSTLLPSNEKKVMRAPPRPLAGKKHIFTSKFTILPKCTACTQYPETEKEAKKKEKKLKAKKKTEEKKLNRKSSPKMQQKYRSKYLNEFRRENQQVVILQSKKDLIQTSSNYSSSGREQESIKRLNLPRLVKAEIYSDESSKALKSKLYENIPIAKEIIKGKKEIENKSTLFEAEPKSLVADAKDNGLYNFFIDLLETTFSVYNVKAQFNSVSVNSDMSISKVEFEIEENVVKKLNVTESSPCPSPEMFDDVTQKPSGNHFYITHDNFWTDKKPNEQYRYTACNEYSKPELPVKTVIKNRKLKTNSFVYNKPPPTVLQDIILLKTSSSRKNRKKYFMSLLKQQLQVDDDVYEEPQNFYQALRVIARNKRRLKEITFNEPKLRTAKSIDFRDTDCTFKRRSLISPRLKSKKYKPKSEFIQSMRTVSREYSDLSYTTRSRPIKPEYLIEDKESYHSVAVYGYDYENVSQSKKPAYQSQKEIIFTYHTSSSEIEDEFNQEEAILNYYGDSQENIRRR